MFSLPTRFPCALHFRSKWVWTKATAVQTPVYEYLRQLQVLLFERLHAYARWNVLKYGKACCLLFSKSLRSRLGFPGKLLWNEFQSKRLILMEIRQLHKMSVFFFSSESRLNKTRANILVFISSITSFPKSILQCCKSLLIGLPGQVLEVCIAARHLQFCSVNILTNVKSLKLQMLVFDWYKIVLSSPWRSGSYLPP